MRMRRTRGGAALTLVATLLLLQACSDNDSGDDTSAAAGGGATAGIDDNGGDDTDGGGGGDGTGAGEPTRYAVTAVNMTSAQPLSPPLLVLHEAGYQAFEVGMPASVALETMAEGGDAMPLAAEAASDASVRSTQIADAPVAPGGSTEWTLEVPAGMNEPRVSVSTMLVNTNDAFTSVDDVVLALAVGESMAIDSLTWDAGTEANSEAAGTIPGPIDGGEGFAAARDDRVDRVTRHPGVLSAADGLNGSVLGEVHRFLDPGMRVVITRTE